MNPQRPLMFRIHPKRPPLQVLEPRRPGFDPNDIRPHLSVYFEGIWKKDPRGIGSHKVGINKSEIRVSAGSYGTTVRTAGDVKNFVRRLRPEEAAELDEIDGQLAELQARRRAVMEKAWQRGHVVTLTELREVAEKRHAKKVSP